MIVEEIHRDIKPLNLLRFGLTIKLSDLGLSVRMGSMAPCMMVCGTSGFMAPEVFVQWYDHKVDYFSYGHGVWGRFRV